VRPTSETGIKGFTLIEVLVVVAITGIVLALAAVNFLPGDAQVARRESGMVALAIERTRDAAWFGGRPMSITFDAGRLRAWRLAGDAWRPDPAGDRALEASVRVVGLYVDGEGLKANERLVFLPDGLGVPFRVALEVRGLPWAVEGDAAGSVRVVEP
jgi:general secretion pathway protein H